MSADMKQRNSILMYYFWHHLKGDGSHNCWLAGWTRRTDHFCLWDKERVENCIGRSDLQTREKSDVVVEGTSPAFTANWVICRMEGPYITDYSQGWKSSHYALYYKWTVQIILSFAWRAYCRYSLRASTLGHTVPSYFSHQCSLTRSRTQVWTSWRYHKVIIRSCSYPFLL